MASQPPSASSSRQSLVLSPSTRPSTRPRTPSLERIAQSNGPKITRQSSRDLNQAPPSPNRRVPSPNPVVSLNRPTSTFSLLSNPSTSTQTPRNGPVITRVQSVMGEPPILGSVQPSSPPPPSQSTSLARHGSLSSDHRNPHSDSEPEEVIRGGESRGGRRRQVGFGSTTSLSQGHHPLNLHTHARDQTSESTTASSLKTNNTGWNGGFTPKASQDPLIVHPLPDLSSSPPDDVAGRPNAPTFPDSLARSKAELSQPRTASGTALSPNRPRPSSPPHLPRPAESIPVSRPFTTIPSTPILSPRSHEPLKRYSLHEGSNRFCLSGLLITSKDNPLPFLASICVAIGLPVLWFAFVGQALWEDSRGQGLGTGGKGAVIVFAYLTLVMWSSMLKASLSDPGILPRNLDESPQRKYVESEAVDPATGEKRPGQFVAEIKYLRVRDGVVGSKWCETCEIYRPPRTSHCRLCDNCVELTDHHCAFLNNCIGRRNYFPFLAFLSSSNLLLMYSIAFTAYSISLTPSDPTHWDSVGSYILLALLVIVSVPVGGLGLYHARLVWKNRTTIEMLRPKSSRGGLNPSTGEAISNLFELSSPEKNCLSVCCRPGTGYGGRGGWRDEAGRDSRMGATAQHEGEEQERFGKEGV
ncbi:hypothetical protein JCM16303_002782 [Sporobolomyces ruberrimus]